jgi:hypothetical protein
MIGLTINYSVDFISNLVDVSFLLSLKTLLKKGGIPKNAYGVEGASFNMEKTQPAFPC